MLEYRFVIYFVFLIKNFLIMFFLENVCVIVGENYCILKIIFVFLYGIKILRKVSLGVIRIEICIISMLFFSSSDNLINYFVDFDILFNEFFIVILKIIS